MNESRLREGLEGVKINKLSRKQYEHDPQQNLTCRGCQGDLPTGKGVLCVVTYDEYRTKEGGEWNVGLSRCPECGVHELRGLNHYAPPSAHVSVKTKREGAWLVIDDVTVVINTRFE